MSFVNVQIPVDSLPTFSAVELERLDPRYPRVTLGLALAFEIPALIAATALIFAMLVPNTGLTLPGAMLIDGALLALLAAVAWFTHTSASVIRYAVREHDIIVRSGVFWKTETIQPITRIQHVEQHQGPVDKRFGLYQLKLFSAGTGHFTFQIPGLDATAAARIKRFIVTVQARDRRGAPASASADPDPPRDAGGTDGTGNAAERHDG